jgi:hypothetical protein
LISDFICPIDSRQAALIANKHDLIAIAIVDPAESQFPPMNFVTFKDLETDQFHIIDTNALTTQNHQQDSLKKRINTCHDVMKQIGAGFMVLHTDKPYIPEIKKFFSIRKKKQQ